MRRSPAPLLVLLALLPMASSADGRLDYLSRQLQKARDPRLRAQSAMMLGASNDPSTLPALCGALADVEPVVRISAVQALGQLQDVQAIGCLEPLARDSNPEAAAAVKRILEVLYAIRNKKPVIYVALGQVTDKSASLEKDLLALAEARLRAHLTSLGTMFAPANESKQAAKTVLKKKKLKGYYLLPQLAETSSGGLSLTMLCFSYPERTLLGEVSVKASGAKPADLIRALAPKAIEEAAENFDWSS